MKTVNYLGNDLTRSSNGNSTMPNKRTELTDNTYNILGLYLVFSCEMAKWTEFVLEE